MPSLRVPPLLLMHATLPNDFSPFYYFWGLVYFTNSAQQIITSSLHTYVHVHMYMYICTLQLYSNSYIPTTEKWNSPLLPIPYITYPLSFHSGLVLVSKSPLGEGSPRHYTGVMANGNGLLAALAHSPPQSLPPQLDVPPCPPHT